MKLTVLGSGTSVPDVLRGPAGLLIETPTCAVLVDGGSGTLQRCAAAGVDPRRLTAGVYSHRHPDHCADLVPLLFAMRVGPPPRAIDYPIWGAEGLSDLVAGLSSAWGRAIELRGDATLRVNEIPRDGRQSRRLAPDLVLITRPANHGAGALHLRFESDGHALVFSGDTGPSSELVRLASDSDLLVCECAGSDDDPVPGHLWPSAIAELVTEARPAAVWLTHMYPHVDPARAVAAVAATGVPTRHASDLDVWSPGSADPSGVSRSSAQPPKRTHRQ
ncbi:MAG: ribonuclease BN (tRNA processing enzyme) [Myxococcota bacterium]